MKNQTIEKAKTQIIFTAKNQYLKPKEPSNNVKLQSVKTLTTQIYFFLFGKQMGLFVYKTR